MKGPKNARLMLTPKSEIGSRRQRGHSRATAPIVPPRPDALRVPIGQVPFFLLQLKRPALRAMRAMRTAVNIISPFVTAGRGGEGTDGKAPSSHAKNMLQRSPAAIAHFQNALLWRNSTFTVCIMILLCDSCQGSLWSNRRRHSHLSLHNHLPDSAPSQDIPVRPSHRHSSQPQHCTRQRDRLSPA